jgi:hypothetical protein
MWMSGGEERFNGSFEWRKSIRSGESLEMGVWVKGVAFEKEWAGPN